MCLQILSHCNISESLLRVAQAYVNQRKLDHEVKTLQVQASQFSKQTAQWISMVENFNQALKVHRLLYIAIHVFHNLVLLCFSEVKFAGFMTNSSFTGNRRRGELGEKYRDGHADDRDSSRVRA